MMAQPQTMRAVKVRFPNDVFLDDTAKLDEATGHIEGWGGSADGDL